MKKLKMQATNQVTFEDICNKYLDNCRQRNLREGTINHYRQSYGQFYKFFDKDMPIGDIDEAAYTRYVLHLRATLGNDVSINSYLRDFITTTHSQVQPRAGELSHLRPRSGHRLCHSGLYCQREGGFP